jgi:TIR domain
LTDIERQDAERLLVLKSVYDISGANENAEVSGVRLLAELGLGDAVLSAACTYLSREGLITVSAATIPGQRVVVEKGMDYRGSFLNETLKGVWITHKGIKEAEKSLRASNPTLSHLEPLDLPSSRYIRRDSTEKHYQYDVCLSFAGEQREYVDETAAHLRNMGVHAFYDRYETTTLWGKNYYDYLQEIYRDGAKYCVMFISADYARKVWTNHERTSAQVRALGEKVEYILPARFDDTEIPGVLPTVGYIDLQEVGSAELAELIAEKLGRSEPV